MATHTLRWPLQGKYEVKIMKEEVKAKLAVVGGD